SAQDTQRRGFVVDFHSQASPTPNWIRGSHRSNVVFDVCEASVFLWRSLERSACLSRLPLTHFLDLLRQFKIFVGDALGGMVLKAHHHPRIGRRDVWIMPSRFRQM